MPVDRELPTREAYDLLALTRELADAELAPHAAQYEREERFPREAFRTLGEAGLLGLPFGEDVGGGGQPYEVYLQVVEELAARWASVALGISVHTLSCFPIDRFGTEAQRRDLLPDMVGGQLLGAYCLSEAHAGLRPRRDARDARRRATTAGWPAARRPGSPTAGRPTSTRRSCARPDDGDARHLLLPPDARTCPASAPPGPRRRWG